jgi:hypothetical protein
MLPIEYPRRRSIPHQTAELMRLDTKYLRYCIAFTPAIKDGTFRTGRKRLRMSETGPNRSISARAFRMFPS